MSETKNSEKDFDIPQALCLQCRLLIEEGNKNKVLFHTRKTPKKVTYAVEECLGGGMKTRKISERRFLKLYKRKYKTQCTKNEECAD